MKIEDEGRRQSGWRCRSRGCSGLPSGRRRPRKRRRIASLTRAVAPALASAKAASWAPGLPLTFWFVTATDPAARSAP